MKTRLAKDVGHDFAVSFYKVCAEHTFNEILKLKENSIAPFLFCSDENEIDEVKKWSNDKFRYYPQLGNDLGERMLNAFNKVFDEGYKKVILVGTDVPGINAKLISKALAHLENYDCVVGPSEDGGYYLIGLNSATPNLFDGISWSTDLVFSKTVETLETENHSYLVLEKLIDVDTIDDLKKWRNNNKSLISNSVKEILESFNV
ncbi:MAG: TIGR04282 family arsenosugar biosynthesis glycosyltransferase [Ignavibacterium sp.]|nr:MAG: TIGR04282 family arsenosugar biosynthesis glycosyltransferase [Ignavibacterium sp.]